MNPAEEIANALLEADPKDFLMNSGVDLVTVEGPAGLWHADIDGHVLRVELDPDATEEGREVMDSVAQFDLSKVKQRTGRYPEDQDLIDAADVGWWRTDGSYVAVGL